MKTIHARHLYIGTSTEMGSTTPPADAQGVAFFQTNTGTMYYWDGDSWEGFGGASTDPNAIHDNVADEITAITEKTSPVGDDELVIEDSEASYVKKSVKITNLPGGADADAIHDNAANEITAITQKTVPIATDEFIIEDSAAGYVKKAVPFSGLEGALSITESQISDLDHDDLDAIHDDVTGEIHAVAEKTTPVGADEVLIEDSAASYAKKRVQITNLPAGSPTEDFSLWCPDAPPASGSSYDDEFDDESFDTGLWTEFDNDSELTISEPAQGLLFTPTGASDVMGIYQPNPTESYWSIYTKVCIMGSLYGGSAIKAGIIVYEDAASNPTTCDLVTLGLDFSTAGVSVMVERWDDYNTHNSNILYQFTDFPVPTHMYLRVRYVQIVISNYLVFDLSTDGLSWAEVYSYEEPFTVDEIGLFIKSASTHYRAYFPFFRMTTGAQTSPNEVLQGDRIKGLIS